MFVGAPTLVRLRCPFSDDRRHCRLGLKETALIEAAPLESQNMFSGDGAANRNDVLGLDPIRNDDHDRLGPYGRRDRDRGRGRL